MSHVDNKQRGFTLIELVLAMGFLSALLLAIAMTIMQLGAIYNQGTTLREINQASREISEDLRRTISSSGAINLSTDYVLTPSSTNPVGGRLCLGAYSYLWNYSTASSTDSNLTKLGTSTSAITPALVKVPDTAKKYCTKSSGVLTNRNILNTDVSKTQQLLRSGDHLLGIHQFEFITPDPVPSTATNAGTSESMYSFQYIIGTNTISALNSDQTACLPASNTKSDPLYCNVQQFTLAIRVGR